MELTTDQKGAIAELAIAREAAELGVGVFKPLIDGERYDLIFDLRPRLVRVQCKWAAWVNDVLIVAVARAGERAPVLFTAATPRRRSTQSLPIRSTWTGVSSCHLISSTDG